MTPCTSEACVCVSGLKERRLASFQKTLAHALGRVLSKDTNVQKRLKKFFVHITNQMLQQRWFLFFFPKLIYNKRWKLAFVKWKIWRYVLQWPLMSRESSCWDRRTRGSQPKFRRAGEDTADLVETGSLWESQKEGGRWSVTWRGETVTQHLWCLLDALVWHGKSPLLTSDGPRVCVYVWVEAWSW